MSLANAVLSRGDELFLQSSCRNLLLFHAQAGDVEAVRSQLHLPCDPNAADAAGSTALHAACRHGSMQLLQLLAMLNPDVNLKEISSVGGCSALHLCVHSSFLAGASFLLANGASINATCSGGFTALHLAARAGNAALVKLLVDAGADLQAKDALGKTAYYYAKASKRRDVMDMLPPQKYDALAPRKCDDLAVMNFVRAAEAAKAKAAAKGSKDSAKKKK